MNMATTHPETQNHELARRLAAAGIPVFPCREAAQVVNGMVRAAKSPYTGTGFYDATCDLDTVNRWWSRWPGAVPAIPTGSTSGIAVIDGDIERETGEALGEAKIAELGLGNPLAVHVRTQSGGVQLLFAHVEGATSTNKQAASHIDTRAEGGYIIAPGSVMGNGASYRYEGRTLASALRAGDLPPYPVEAVRAAIEARRQAKEGGHKAKRPGTGSSFDVGDPGSTNATDAETLEVLRHLLATAPNGLCRDDWVKLAVSLRVGFGDTLRSDFIAFSERFTGTPCSAADALHVWDSADRPKEVSSVAPALSLLRSTIGPDEWRATWQRVFSRRDAEPPVPVPADTWPEPAARFLRGEFPPAPDLPLRDVVGPRLAQWVEDAAEAKGAPPDYVFASVLAVAGAAIGNARWVSPWKGWAEPPVIWTMCVGLPSAGKSPAIDAAVQPLQKAERPLREAAQAEAEAWAEKAELAKLAEATWKENAKAALKAGKTPPERPQEAQTGPEPHTPRLVVNDGTIERIGAILARQPRGTFQLRDELAGWLEGMQRYSKSSDRPFWLEAYGGRRFTVERVGRDPLTIDRLTIGVLGGIQPDRLKSLLFKADDDGLLARFLPIWPEPAPLRRPQTWADEAMMERALGHLLSLQLVTEEDGAVRPWLTPFAEDARALMDDFRPKVRTWETETEGLLRSFVGKLPGLAARLSLVLGYLDSATEGTPDPREITAAEFGRAVHLVEDYLLPMARRAYADAATPKAERGAKRLVSIIREQGWKSFTSRDVLRLDRAGLGTAADLNPALAALEDGDCIRPMAAQTGARGGRPSRHFTVNPALHRIGGAKA